MKSNLKMLISLTIVILALSLSACGPSAPVEPTVDPNMIKTEAVQTAFAQMTLEAIMNPSATPVPTETPIPTNTPEPTFTATAATQVALPGVATLAVALPGVATVAPASGLAPVTTGDKAEWVTQQPEDGKVFNLGSSDYPAYVTKVDSDYLFDVVWTMKNTGTTTWNKSYKLRYFSGAKFFGGKTEFNFPDRNVLPGETTNLPIDAVLPKAAGTYLSTWVLTNPEGGNFSVVTVEIKVVDSE